MSFKANVVHGSIFQAQPVSLPCSPFFLFSGFSLPYPYQPGERSLLSIFYSRIVYHNGRFYEQVDRQTGEQAGHAKN